MAGRGLALVLAGDFDGCACEAVLSFQNFVCLRRMRCQGCGVMDVPLGEDAGYRGDNLVRLAGQLDSGAQCGEAAGHHLEVRYFSFNHPPEKKVRP